jgi:DNA-binding CsgD family transcriptional regulator
LVDLFGLLPSEARLAWMLGQATSIADAADALGLTIETARNYSKKIYAKTGARGQAELVRIILTSVLAVS